ncbi:transketolase family protein [Patescibacteria group bacterium]|nr:transketolase family protein [Patescibacteria group bacterium]
MLNEEMNLTRFWTSQNDDTIEMKSMRDGFGEGLREAGKRNKNVVVLTADLMESTRANLFAEEFPDRFFDLGIAEQNMMGVAAGMALSSKIPFVCSYAVFSPGRNWEQLRVSVCLSKTNVKIAGAHAGFSAGADGATHQALEDMAITRALPNLMVLAPCDYEQIKKAVLASAQIKGPVYIRYHKQKLPQVTTVVTPFELGRAQIFREGKDVSVFVCGPMVNKALRVAEKLQSKVGVEVINVHTIKPIDKEVIVRSAKKTGRVVTVEEHEIIGGLGSAVAEVLGENCPVLIKRVGVRDTFGESGEYEELVEKYGVGEKDIEEAILKV